MKRTKRTFQLILLILLVSACSQTNLTPIPKNQSLIASLNIYDQTITFIESDTQQIVTWDIPHPFKNGLFISDDQLLLLNKEADESYLYELSTGKSTKWNLGTGIETALVSNNMVYFANQDEKKVQIVNKHGDLVKEASLEYTPYFLFEQNDYLYVSYLDHASITVLSKKDIELVDSFQAIKGASGGLVQNNELWLGGHGTGEHIQEEVYVYDLSQRQQLTKIPAPIMPVDFAVYQNSIYVLSHGSNTLREFKLSTHKEIRSLEVGANPFSMVLSGHLLYISSYDANEVNVIDLLTFEQVKTIPVGDGPLHLLNREGEN
ncbi:YncE family protein [Bacillus weihaiensis]|uniref:YncE family protein n=1 Tax=Bacillus weihaiensis TaxID=1547283 RepID=UPI002357ED2E|nr:hypothetical protein [Bacillus weihaiensis]